MYRNVVLDQPGHNCHLFHSICPARPRFTPFRENKSNQTWAYIEPVRSDRCANPPSSVPIRKTHGSGGPVRRFIPKKSRGNQEWTTKPYALMKVLIASARLQGGRIT